MSGPPPANLPDLTEEAALMGGTISLKHSFAPSPTPEEKSHRNSQQGTALSWTKVSGFQWRTAGFVSQISHFQAVWPGMNP